MTDIPLRTPPPRLFEPEHGTTNRQSANWTVGSSDVLTIARGRWIDWRAGDGAGRRVDEVSNGGSVTEAGRFTICPRGPLILLVSPAAANERQIWFTC